MKLTLLLVATMLLAACGSASSVHKSTNESTAQSSSNGKTRDAGYEVKVTRNGTGFASYSQTGPRTTVLYEGESLTMFLGSPDNKHVLTVSLQAAKAGTYPVADRGTPKHGEARVELISNEDPPIVLLATSGELKVDLFNEKTFSGSFVGTGTDIKGASFTIEGKFSNLTVKNAAE